MMHSDGGRRSRPLSSADQKLAADIAKERESSGKIDRAAGAAEAAVAAINQIAPTLQISPEGVEQAKIEAAAHAAAIAAAR